MRHVLDQRMRLVLARMEVFLSYGTTQAFDKSGSRGKPSGGDRPAGDSAPVHEFYAAMYNRCSTNAERENVILEAEQEFEKLKQQKPPENIEAYVNRNTLAWKRAIARSELPVSATADKFGVSRATVYSYREKYGD